MKATPANERWLAVGIVLVTLAVKAVLAARWGVLADEAYYAMWGQQPALGYFDQPPLIGLWLAYGPKTALGLRAGALLSGVVGALAMVAVHRDKLLAACWWTAVLPLAWLTGFMTPDAFLLAFWALTLVGAIRGGRGWWAAGVFGALATLSKYSGLAVFPLAWWAVRDRGRDPWIGLLLFVSILAPHGWWLQQNGHVSLLFQLREGLVHPHTPGLWGPLGVLGQQLALLNPLLFGLAGFAWMRWPTTREARIAWMTSAPVAGFFFLAALGGPPEAHWLAPCWVGLGLLLDGASGRAQRATWAGLGVGLFASLVLVVHAEVGVFRLPIDPRDRLLEGAVLGEAVGGWALPEGVGAHEEGVGQAAAVLTERYQEAALIWWNTGIPARRHPECGRADQFDLWLTPVPARFYFVRPTTSGPLTCAPGASSRHPVVGQTLAGDVVGRWDLFEVGP